MALVYLWRVYHRLRRRKGSSGFGVSPIKWPDIDAFVRNSRFELRPWEIEVIEELDDLYMAEQSRLLREKETDASPCESSWCRTGPEHVTLSSST